MSLDTTPNLEEHTGFLLAEEAALKRYVSGMEVPNKGGKLAEVPTYFRWPESERVIRYPFITIDLLGISPAFERWYSEINEYSEVRRSEFVDADGRVRLGHYYPSVTYDATPDPEIGYHTGNFKAYDLMFQVSTWSRSVLHDRYLQSRFLTTLFPPRGNFFIGVDADHTWRRSELLEWIPGDTLETTEAAKKTFRKIFTIRMEAEIPSSVVYELVKARKLHVDIYDIDDTPLAAGHASDSPAHDTILDSYNIDPPTGT